jgi:hypothetical protein
LPRIKPIIYFCGVKIHSMKVGLASVSGGKKILAVKKPVMR